MATPANIVPVPAQRFFKIKEASKYLGQSVDSLRLMADLGQIPARRYRGKRMFLLEDLNAWIESQPNWIA